MTQTGRVMGTVDYMAPEQARDAKNVDVRADIYSLGCTAFYILHGQTPAPSGSAAEKLLWHQAMSPPPLDRGLPCRDAAAIGDRRADDGQERPTSDPARWKKLPTNSNSA